MSEHDPRKKDQSWLDWLYIQACKPDDLLIDNEETIAGIKQTRKVITGLLNLARLAPGGCICHVESSDGYHGINHSDWCEDYMVARDDCMKIMKEEIGNRS